MSDTVIDLQHGIFRRIYAAAVSGQRINRVNMQAECLFWRLHMIADDFGNFDADVDLVRAYALPKRRGLGPRTIERWLTQLIDAGLIVLYEDQGDRLGHIVGFLHMQPRNRSGRRVRRIHAWPGEAAEEAGESPPEDDGLDEPSGGDGGPGGTPGSPGENGGYQSENESEDQSENQSENEDQAQAQTRSGPDVTPRRATRRLQPVSPSPQKNSHPTSPSSSPPESPESPEVSREVSTTRATASAPMSSAAAGGLARSPVATATPATAHPPAATVAQFPPPAVVEPRDPATARKLGRQKWLLAISPLWCPADPQRRSDYTDSLSAFDDFIWPENVSDGQARLTRAYAAIDKSRRNAERKMPYLKTELKRMFSDAAHTEKYAATVT